MNDIIGMKGGVSDTELRANPLAIMRKRSPLAKEFDSEISALSVDIEGGVTVAMVRLCLPHLY
jgi:hypothetical protein